MGTINAPNEIENVPNRTENVFLSNKKNSRTKTAPESIKVVTFHKHFRFLAESDLSFLRLYEAVCGLV